MPENTEQAPEWAVTPIIVSAEEFQWLSEQLDAPPTDLPRLREALAKEPIWLLQSDSAQGEN